MAYHARSTIIFGKGAFARSLPRQEQRIDRHIFSPGVRFRSAPFFGRGNIYAVAACHADRPKDQGCRHRSDRRAINFTLGMAGNDNKGFAAAPLRYPLADAARRRWPHVCCGQRLRRRSGTIERYRLRGAPPFEDCQQSARNDRLHPRSPTRV